MDYKARVLALLQIVKRDPRPQLFGFRSPGAVRTAALKGIEQRPDTDFLVTHARKDVESYAPRAGLLESWKGEGHWGISRLQMKTEGELKAERNAVRQAVLNLAALNLYGVELAKGKKRLKALISFAEPHLFRPLIEKNRLFPLAAFAARILAEAGCAGFLPARFRRELTARLSGAVIKESLSSAAAGAELHKKTSAIHHGLIYRFHCGEDIAEEGRILLECLAGRRDAYPSGALERLLVPGIAFSLVNALEIAAAAGLDADHQHVAALMSQIIDLQDSKGLWRSSRQHPLDDEDLFLTLIIVLLIMNLMVMPEENSESADASDQDGGSQ